MASPPSASRASPSTSPTGSFRPTSANSSSPIRPATSSTPATWRPAPRNADLALVLIDARKGVLTQTRRHSFILSPDRREARGAGGQQDRPRRLRRRASSTRSRPTTAPSPSDLGFETLEAIPVSALRGDNILTPERRTRPGTRARSSCPISRPSKSRPTASPQPMRFPVQWVNRPNLDFRGFSGTVASGVGQRRRRRAGCRLAQARQDHPHRHHGWRPRRGHRRAGRDAGARPRGRHLARRRAHPSRRDPGILQPVPGAADLDERGAGVSRPLLPAQDRRAAGRRPRSPTSNSAPTSTRSSRAPPRPSSSTRSARVTIATDKPIAFDSYADNGRTGGFILIDRMTNATLGAGVIDFGLRRAQNLSYQSFDVNREVRAADQGADAAIVWFTGLSGSGKSTVANLVEKRLTAEGRHAYILDGDNVRHGLNKDLGFTEEARVENIRRVAEVARLMADAGLIVLVSLHLAVPQRAAAGPRDRRRRRASPRSTSTPRSRSAKRATPRASTPAPAAARSRTSPASTPLRGARRRRISCSTAPTHTARRNWPTSSMPAIFAWDGSYSI